MTSEPATAPSLEAASAPSSEASDLFTKLNALAKKDRKLIRSSIHAAPADPSIKVRSWKMNEFMYYNIPSPFPTLARGLFSTETDSSQEEGKASKTYQMVARGYDKFFNIGEVPFTTVSFLIFFFIFFSVIDCYLLVASN
jgi:tRNA ligase